jgi:hypothetical protein
MKLLTKALLNAFKKQGDTSKTTPINIPVICKFFYPAGAGTWYATEFDHIEGKFFGFVSVFNDHNDELGYFSLQELQDFRGRFGLGIERDKFFEPRSYNLQQIIDGARP